MFTIQLLHHLVYWISSPFRIMDGILIFVTFGLIKSEYLLMPNLKRWMLNKYEQHNKSKSIDVLKELNIECEKIPPYQLTLMIKNDYSFGEIDDITSELMDHLKDC